ncbi:MAG: two-component regulator propeller domain-containing protein [Chitinophagaceae bacterium]
MFLKEYVFIPVSFIAVSVFSQPSIGNWRDHLSYYQALQVVAAAGTIYCATPQSLYTVDLADNSINRLSKTNGLSEVGISTIQLDEQTGKLLVAYNNSNIDIIYKKDIINVDAIKRKNTTGSKAIHNIYFYRNNAYLCTGLGVVVIDAEKYEVKDTYVIGNGGGNTKVNGFATDGQFFYAASDEGLKKANATAINLSDFRNWQLLSGTAGLPEGVSQQVLHVQNRIIVQKGDSLFVSGGNAWSLLYTSDWEIIQANSSSGKIVITQQKPGAGSRVVLLNADGFVERTIKQPGTIINPRQGVIVQNEVWIADAASGLLRSSGNGFLQYQPNSPRAVLTGEMIFSGNSLLVAGGYITTNWNNTFSKNGYYRFTDNEWINNYGLATAADSLYDVVTITRDARDNSVWAGSFGGGLVQLKADLPPQVFKHNSPISPSLFDPESYRVAGLAFDSDHHLWISNYGAAQSLAVRKADGNWQKFTIPFSYGDNAVTQIVIDDYNQKWIVSPNGNGLFCFNHGNSVENTGDDRWAFFRAGKGAGNLPDNNVLSIAKDKNSFIWVGTTKGIGIIRCTQQVFTVSGCEAVLPVVQQDNFAGYLFRDEEVQCIAVDGGDRKWIGTKNGTWLISADAEKTIYHFRDDNSPLLDNDVRKIAIDPGTGEVFFATAKGICSFRSTSTEGGSANENVLVFPNPVPPGYTGAIAIRGLVSNAIVKITELDGRLVYQARAIGGQATWNGRDYKGRKRSTGVYLVLISDETRKEKLATKIVFVN